MLTSLGLIILSHDPYIARPKTNDIPRESNTNMVVRMNQIRVESHIDFKDYRRKYVFKLIQDDDERSSEVKQKLVLNANNEKDFDDWV